MTAEQNKLLVRHLVEGAVNPGNLDVLDEVTTGSLPWPHAAGSGPSGTHSLTSRWRSSTLVPTMRKSPRISGALGPT